MLELELSEQWGMRCARLGDLMGLGDSDQDATDRLARRMRALELQMLALSNPEQ